MNGRPPTPAPIPPSVQQARRQQLHGRRAWTGLWSTRIVGVLLALAVVAIVVAKVATQMQSKAPKATPTESTMEPTWGRQTFQYKAEEPVLPPEPKPPADTISPELVRLRDELAAMRQDIEGLKNRKTTTSGQQWGERRGPDSNRPTGHPRPPALCVA